jgi:bla regulator protein blaR1
MLMPKALLLATLVVVFPPRAIFGQPAFEVASVKPNKSGDNSISMRRQPGGRVTVTNAPLRMLITFAYDLREHQLSGGPGWLNSDRYDIVAKAESPNPTEEEMKLMFQTLLADRFQLKAHRETKELPVYALSVGKNGPKLSKADAAGKGPQMMSTGRGQLKAKKTSIEQFAKLLGNQLGRTVLDKTGLPGDFDFDLTWTPDVTQPLGPKEGGVDGPPPADPAGPSIFTAIQEQLGLKLESQKGPVEILVIDSVERASEN